MTSMQPGWIVLVSIQYVVRHGFKSVTQRDRKQDYYQLPFFEIDSVELTARCVFDIL